MRSPKIVPTEANVLKGSKWCKVFFIIVNHQLISVCRETPRGNLTFKVDKFFAERKPKDNLRLKGDNMEHLNGIIA